MSIRGPQGILNIGISMDQSATNQLLGNQQGIAQWPPESMAGTTICVSPNSTGEYVVQSCLKNQGFNVQDVEFMYGQQADCIAAMTPSENGTAQVGVM
jgi:ABC-type nitrate/sulfonate/bicarbonate transport system substrate-binding protein